MNPKNSHTLYRGAGAIVIIGLLVILGYGLFKKNIGSIDIPKTGDAPATLVGEKVPFLNVPDGFAITYYAKNVRDARVIEFDPRGRMLVSQPDQGSIMILNDTNSDGVADEQHTLVKGLSKPHGMAWKCPLKGNCKLYVAESNALVQFDYNAENATATGRKKLIDISYALSDNHFTRSLVFLPSPHDDTLLISVGSSCNVCHEKDSDHAAILSYNVVTGIKEVYAKGLRNAVFMTLDPIGGQIFATEMGRDGLGDNIPPDEINIIKKDGNYGWPVCYGKNIHDDNFDKNTYIRNPCMAPFETPSLVDLQAHSAPLGLSFIPEEGWPEDMWHDLLVSYHGSWNRSEPTGYKVVRVKFGSRLGGIGKYQETEDFITGWLTPDGKKLGRPVDIKTFPGGTAYISDDMAGVIYKLSRTSQ